MNLIYRTALLMLSAFFILAVPGSVNTAHGAEIQTITFYVA
jgi:hypothetical protein